MSPTLDEQIEKLKSTIAEMEAQRPALGDEVVEAALAPLQRKLDELVAMLGAQKATTPTGPPQQRKLVTLLFMDIAGSTAIAQDMDPEDVREVFDIALNKLAKPVEAHGGRVTRFMGDGFLSAFGAPLAREDDPERAIRAGLAIIETAQELAPELEVDWGIPDFQVRVGVNTGLVSIGGLTEAQDTLMGAAVNLGARLESAAPAGGLLISHDTYRHVRGLFDVEPQEPIQAKGFDEPISVYRVLRLKPRAFRTYTRGVEGVETRMIGRHDELKYLQDALLSAIEESEGQVVTFTGEAGVGKSRLLYEFQNWIELLPQRVRLFEGRAQQEAQGLPYGLLRDLFEFRFKVQDDEPLDSARKKFTIGLMKVFEGAEEGELRAHILGQLLGYDFSTSPHLKGVVGDAEQMRNRGLMYLGEYFQGLCAQGPVVLFLEDIHWADDSSLDALSWLGERLHQKSLLVVCAARPALFERRPYWGEGQSYHTHLDLLPLSRRESRQLIAEIFKFADHLPDELRELVVEGAEGNPFYLEELIKMLVEDGVVEKGEQTWQIHPERLAEVEVPPTLAGVLQARLDSLPVEERVVLQQASVVGRQFWDRVVAHIQAAGDGAPQFVPENLTALRGRELIYRREASAFSNAHEYLFKNEILREVTYESVLKRLRRRYHGLVADWLIVHGAGRAGEYSGLIAEHLLQAGRKEQACDYFIRAGKSALETYANSEAEAHFRKALELSPRNPKRAVALAGLGEALGWQGHTDEAQQNLRQAIDLYYEMEDHDKMASLYTILAKVLFHDDYQKAWEVCQEGLGRLVDAPEGPGMARLLAEAGRAAHFRARPVDEVIALCQKAIRMAERLGIVEVQAEASITLAFTKDDHQESIAITQEAVSLSEAHGVLGPAARAHFNLGTYYLMSLRGAERSYQHYKRAAEINGQIGNAFGMIFALRNSIFPRANLVHLSTIRDDIADFLQRSNAVKSQVNECLQFIDAYISHFAGAWTQALAYCRATLEELRKGGSLQIIAHRNLQLADTILEMHRFGELDDLAEAEAALLENIDLQWAVYESNVRLAVIAARKGLLQKAHDRLAEASQAPDQKLTQQAKVELALAAGHWEEAVAVCKTQINIYQAGGFRWEWARQLIDQGDAFLQRAGPEDVQRARQAYQQSLETFTELGASGYVKVLEERLGRI